MNENFLASVAYAVAASVILCAGAIWLNDFEAFAFGLLTMVSAWIGAYAGSDTHGRLSPYSEYAEVIGTLAALVFFLIGFISLMIGGLS